jgi:hypothetical protein
MSVLTRGGPPIKFFILPEVAVVVKKLGFNKPGRVLLLQQRDWGMQEHSSRYAIHKFLWLSFFG